MIDIDDYAQGPRKGRSYGGRGGRGRGRGRGGGKGNQRNNGKPRTHQPIQPELYDHNKVFIGNIHRSVTNEMLQNYLSSFARVVYVKVIRKQNYNALRPRGYGATHYGFAQMASEEATQLILNLDEKSRVLNGNCMDIKPAKKEFKLPGAPGFCRTPLSDRDFDLEPLDEENPSMHMLNDDVMLRVFEYLPLKPLIRVERVCRRWQSLVHSLFRKKACREIKEDISTWMVKNEVFPNPFSISKVLLLCGQAMTELSLSEVAPYCHGRLIRIISQLCPALESLTLWSVLGIQNMYLEELIRGCSQLKAFRIKGRNSFSEANLKSILRIPKLEVLHLEGADIQGKAFKSLPEGLKVLNISNCSFIHNEYIPNISKRCPLLEVLRLEGVSVFKSTVIELSKNCPNLCDLAIEITGISSQAEMSDFKNLKLLGYAGHMYSVNTLIKSLPQVEELRLDGMMSESMNDLVDFSILTNLKVLTVSCPLVTFSTESIRTLVYCSKLEKLRFKGNNDHKPAILELIRKCPKLEKLDCSSITLLQEDIQAFVEANKSRKNKLHFVVGLDRNAMDQIEKLCDANYDVDMFDSHNLFGTFDVYDEFDDLMNDIYYDSGESIASDEGYYLDGLEDEFFPRLVDPLPYHDLVYAAMNAYDIYLSDDEYY